MLHGSWDRSAGADHRYIYEDEAPIKHKKFKYCERCKHYHTKGNCTERNISGILCDSTSTSLFQQEDYRIKYEK